jgi:hypothetical protein
MTSPDRSPQLDRPLSIFAESSASVAHRLQVGLASMGSREAIKLPDFKG